MIITMLAVNIHALIQVMKKAEKIEQWKLLMQNVKHVKNYTLTKN